MTFLARSAGARYVLRALVATTLAVLSVAATLWADEAWLKLATTGLGVLAGYLGVGAVSGAVEPRIGRTMDVAP